MCWKPRRALAIPFARFVPFRGYPSPAQLRREMLRDKLLVVRTQRLYVRPSAALRVEIVRIERLNPAQHLAVLSVRQMRVSALLVPGVERVVADHIERRF